MSCIEERAKHLASLSENLFQKTAYTYYVCGAKEQRAIDIQRACEWLDKQIYDSVIVVGGNDSYDEHLKSEFIRNFKEAMEME